MKKSKIGLSVLVLTLALAVAVSFVAISHLLIKTGKENPYGNIDISASENGENGDSNSKKTENSTSKPTPPQEKEQNVSAEIVGGKNGVYHKEIQIFHAEYDESGEVTVKSAEGDRVVAPGTQNSYDLYVRNVGNVPISYILEAQSFLTVTVDGKEVQIPVDASFSTPKNSYMLGADDSLEHLSGLDGAKDYFGLSAEHQAKYTLTWGWPFGEDDEFDTMLGNLAAEGEDLTVKVAFNVTASYDPNADGGSPITGDMRSIGMWIALFVISTFTLIILLFLRKRENDEEKSQTKKEKNR